MTTQKLPENLDLAALHLRDLESLSRRFSTAFTAAMTSAVRDGRSLDDTLKGLALRLSNVALSAGMKPLERLLATGLDALVSSGVGALTGGVGAGPSFAGGIDATRSPVVPAPTLSPGGVTVNIQTPDASSFARSQTQVSMALARAVGRARRGL